MMVLQRASASSINRTLVRLLLLLGFPAALGALISCSTPRDSSSDSASAAANSAPQGESAGVASSAQGTALRELYGQQPGQAVITPDGWGPLRIGMTRSEVVAAAGEDANPGAVGGPNPEECDEFRPRNAPDGTLVMLENGILTRVSVSRNREVASPSGIRIGDPQSRIVDTYGDLAVVEPHKYVEPPAAYITFWRDTQDSTARRGIRYELDANGQVAHIRGGGASIAYVEGCL